MLTYHTVLAEAEVVIILVHLTLYFGASLVFTIGIKSYSDLLFQYGSSTHRLDQFLYLLYLRISGSTSDVSLKLLFTKAAKKRPSYPHTHILLSAHPLHTGNHKFHTGSLRPTLRTKMHT